MPLKLLNQALGTITMVPEEGTSQNFTVTIPATNGTMAVIPTGLITLWYGNTANVPGSWVLCDGQNGTPDLRDRFVVGAGGAYTPRAVGGSADAIVVSHTHTVQSGGTHNHSITDPGHTHGFQGATSGTGGAAGVPNQGPTGGSVATNSALSGVSITAGQGAHTHTLDSAGASGTNANLPPYMALCYIMKL